MYYQVNKQFEEKNFELGQIAKAIKTFLKTYNIDCESILYSLYYEQNDIEWNDRVEYKDLYKITDFNNRNLQTVIFSHKVEGYNNHDFYIELRHRGKVISLSFESPTLELAQQNLKLIQNELELTEVKEKQSSSLSDEIARLNGKVISLEQKLNIMNDGLKCFISYRFNERTERYILELNRFLNLTGVETITGSDYQPRRISEKVTEKLKTDFDFIIYVVTKEGESAWCRDELGTSYGKDCHIIPVVEEGCKLESGILSDWEYITFKQDHISDVFIKLLEGIRYIKKEKESSISI